MSWALPLLAKCKTFWVLLDANLAWLDPLMLCASASWWYTRRTSLDIKRTIKEYSGSNFHLPYCTSRHKQKLQLQLLTGLTKCFAAACCGAAVCGIWTWKKKKPPTLACPCCWTPWYMKAPAGFQVAILL
jgi:hypothetical protein